MRRIVLLGASIVLGGLGSLLAPSPVQALPDDDCLVEVYLWDPAVYVGGDYHQDPPGWCPVTCAIWIGGEYCRVDPPVTVE